MTDSKTYTEFSPGDTVVTGHDVDITVFDITITVPKGTKAIVHTVREPYIFNALTGEKEDKYSTRLFFGFGSPHYDSWAMYWGPISSRKVLIEKTIEILKYDNENKYSPELYRRKMSDGYYDRIIIPKFK